MLYLFFSSYHFFFFFWFHKVRIILKKGIFKIKFVGIEVCISFSTTALVSNNQGLVLNKCVHVKQSPQRNCDFKLDHKEEQNTTL